MLAEQGKLPDLLEKGLSNGSNHVVPVNGFDDESPQSPSAFFAELQNTFEEMKHETPSRTTRGSENGLAEFMTKITNNHASPAKESPPSPPSPQRITTQRGRVTNGPARIVNTKLNNTTQKLKPRATINGDSSSVPKVTKSVAALVAARKRKRGKRGSMTRFKRKF